LGKGAKGLKIFKKIKEKIIELWKNANKLQRFGLCLIVSVLVVIKILKWALVLKVCCSGLALLWNRLLQIL